MSAISERWSTGRDECVPIPQSQLVFYLLHRAIIIGARRAHADFGLNTKLSACAHALYGINQPTYDRSLTRFEIGIPSTIQWHHLWLQNTSHATFRQTIQREKGLFCQNISHLAPIRIENGETASRNRSHCNASLWRWHQNESLEIRQWSNITCGSKWVQMKKDQRSQFGQATKKCMLDMICAKTGDWF